MVWWFYLNTNLTVNYVHNYWIVCENMSAEKNYFFDVFTAA